MILNAPLFVTNDTIHHDLQVPSVKEEIINYCTDYYNRLKNHPNILTAESHEAISWYKEDEDKVPTDFINKIRIELY